MPGKKKSETDIFVPVLNEKTIKKISHWDLGLINSDWSFHRNFNQFVQDLLIRYQQEVATRYHFYNVFRFYLENTTLENNQNIESASLGLLLHAFESATHSEFSFPVLCATGSLCNGEEGLSLKCVDRIEEKFGQFMNSLQSPAHDKTDKCCFICVTESGETVQMKNKLEELLSAYPVQSKKEIVIMVFSQGDSFEDVLDRLVLKKKHKVPVPVFIAGGVIAIALMCSLVMLNMPHEIKNILLDNSGWIIQEDTKGSGLSLALVPYETETAIEMSYRIVKDGWVLIKKEIAPRMIADIKGIGFSIKSDGERHTLEVKLQYPRDTTFGISGSMQSVGDGWIRYRFPIEEFKCWWPETECIACKNKLDRSAVSFIHFAISNKQNDLPGSGTMRISEIYFF